MADRKKVIKGLECCLANKHNNCPYKSTDDGIKVTTCTTYLMQDALAMLKAQEPKSPITSEVQYGDHLQHCPSCGKALPNRGEYGKSHYCYKCGQAVK